MALWYCGGLPRRSEIRTSGIAELLCLISKAEIAEIHLLINNMAWNTNDLYLKWMPMRPLDIDAVSAFVLAADLRSFTRAAEAQGTTQSAISLKLKRLERRLGQRLLERTPRVVRLSAEGAAFLDRARDLIAAHDRAVNRDAVARRLGFGISDHAAGPELAVLLARINTYDPHLRLDVRVAASRDVLASFDRGELDAVIVRREGDRRDGETLLHDHFGWFAAPTYAHRPGEPLRLATLSSQCGVRALAVRALDAARLPWLETFVGGGVAGGGGTG